MRKTLRNLLDRLGLLRPARRVKSFVKDHPANWRVRDWLRARGWIKWTPLIPEEDFTRSCSMAIKRLQDIGHDFGSYLEFGVSRGTSLACMARALADSGLEQVRLIGFDSFKGLPEEAEHQGWRPGQYASTLAATKRYLAKAGVDAEMVDLVPGWFSDTLTSDTINSLDIDKASLIMVDCDIYSASREALWFAEALIEDRAVVIFDDWGWRVNAGQIGQREAFAEFLDAFPTLESEELESYRPEAKIFLLTRTTPGGW